jgi:hypothetical protein
MRSLALLLIALNLAFLYWHTFHREPAGPVFPSNEITDHPGAARLVLLSERDGQPVSEPVAVGLRCETVGPLLDPDAAVALQAVLEEQGALAGLRTSSREVVSAYWVFLPPQHNRQAALELARTLTGQGLDDLYVLNEGEQRNALSLGLFSEHERAMRRVRQAEALGYAPRIEARFRTQTVYWLDLVIPEDRIASVFVPNELGRMDRPCPADVDVTGR